MWATLSTPMTVNSCSGVCCDALEILHAYLSQRMKTPKDVKLHNGRPVCQFGKRCYRKNPVHFTELAHPELEAIVMKGRNSRNEFDIPEDLLTPLEELRQQLTMIEGVVRKGAVKADLSGAASGSGTPKRNLSATPIRKPDEKKRTTHEVISLDSSDDEETAATPKRQKLLAPARKPIEKSATKHKFDSPSATKYLTKTPTPTSATKAKLESPSTSKGVNKSAASSYVSRAVLDTPSTSRPGTSKLEQKPKVVATTAPRLIANDLKGVERRIEDYIDMLYPKGEAIKKFEASHPYNYFLTAILDSPATHKEQLSITMQEILDKSLGDLESSVQINFMVDIGWLIAHYFFAGHDTKPLLVLYGDETPELLAVKQVRPNVTAIKIQMNHVFATHHSKVMLLGYKDRSMRVVVSTANLYEDDWRNRSQGIWISPRCFEMDSHGHSSNGESVTGFRSDLIRYLNKYNQPSLQEWTARILRTDFSAVKVFLVCSVPGSHQTLQNTPLWGHLRLGYLLSQHAAPIEDSCPVIAQSSSIGSLGNSFNAWALEITTSFSRDAGPPRLRRTPGFKMIFPSYNNVLAGHDGLLSGGGLPYRRENHMKHRWLENHLNLWRANQRHRTKAMPHIKTYCRYSESEGLHWFCLTSANFSKSAWGSVNRGAALGQTLRINNYEVGVLFIPKIMVDRPAFPLKPGQDSQPIFPMIYDLPLVPYSVDDTPFFSDYLINALK